MARIDEALVSAGIEVIGNLEHSIFNLEPLADARCNDCRRSVLALTVFHG